jgi:hypothetical protein
MRRHFLILATLATFIFLVSCKDLREETVYFLDIQGDIVSLEGQDRGDGLMDHLECSVSVINHGDVVSSLTYVYINTEELGTIEGRFIGLVFKNLGNLETSFVIDLPYATPVLDPKITSYQFVGDEDLILKGYKGKPISSTWKPFPPVE